MGINRVHTGRQRRAKKTRKIIQEANKPRLSVHISLQHLYAQVFAVDGKVLASASTLDKEVASALTNKSPNKATAAIIGQYIAKRALAAGIKQLGFDRSGYKYHGRVKALADAAREEGLEF